jgi:hypothetical protein
VSTSDGLTAAITVPPSGSGDLVWLATKLYLDTTGNGSADTNFSDLNINIAENTRVFVTNAYSVPITSGGGATALVYLPRVL